SAPFRAHASRERRPRTAPFPFHVKGAAWEMAVGLAGAPCQWAGERPRAGHLVLARSALALGVGEGRLPRSSAVSDLLQPVVLDALFVAIVFVRQKLARHGDLDAIALWVWQSIDLDVEVDR